MHYDVRIAVSKPVVIGRRRKGSHSWWEWFLRGSRLAWISWELEEILAWGSCLLSSEGRRDLWGRMSCGIDCPGASRELGGTISTWTRKSVCVVQEAADKGSQGGKRPQEGRITLLNSPEVNWWPRVRQKH